jgi:hypothetical protein
MDVAGFQFGCGSQYKITDAAEDEAPAENSREYWAAKKAENLKKQQEAPALLAIKVQHDEQQKRAMKRKRKAQKKQEKKDKKQRKKEKKKDKKRAKKQKKEKKRSTGSGSSSGSGSGSGDD